MVTLFGALLGFLGSAVPELFKLYRDKQDRQHELAILQLQMEQQQQGGAQRLEEIAANADIGEAQALYQTYKTGIDWVDALNGTVRPVLAYAFFMLYAAVKWMQFALVDSNVPASIYILWNVEDQAIFAGIISFYFGSRAMNKMRQKR